MLTCPDRQVLADYALGKLSEPLASSLDEHVESCSDCQDQLGSLDAENDPLLEKLRQPVPDDGFSREPECRQGVIRAAQIAAGRSPQAAIARVPEQLRDYRILGPLGRGGMGRVYRAVHTRLNKEVALKIIAPERRNSPAAARRFEQEMKAIGRLDHPHVVRATDAGEEDSLAYLAMELVSGVDLAAIVRRRGPLPIAAACELTRQAAAGLAYLHAHQLVHRDIKPANLMLDRQGNVKILDLGLALLIEPESGPLTGGSHLLGTADYLAPEQIDACHEVTALADIYSLGCALYELLTGKPPFSGELFAATTRKLLAHYQTAAPPLGEKRPDVPAELAALVEQMLAKAPADRPQTAADVAGRLARFAVNADLPALISAERPTVEPPPSQSEVATGTLSGFSSTPDAAVSKKIAAAEANRKPLRGLSRVALALAGFVLLAAVAIVIRKGDSVRAYFRLDKGETITIEDLEEPVASNDPAALAAPRKSSRATLRGLLPRPDPIEGIGPWQLHTVNPQGVSSIDWSKDGRWLAVGGHDVRLYEVDGLRLSQVVDCHHHGVTSVRLQEGLDRAGTTGGDRTLKLVDFRDGSSLSIDISDHGGISSTGGWSPDMKFAVSTGGDGMVKLWNDDGTLARVLGQMERGGQFLCWHSDSRKLATRGGDHAVHLWNVDGSPGGVLRKNGEFVGAACFSPDGSQIAVGGRGAVRLWKTDGTLRHTLAGHSVNGQAHDVLALAWAPDGELVASGGTDFCVRFWTADGAPGPVAKVPNWVAALAWSPDGQRLAAGTVSDLNILARDGSPDLQRLCESRPVIAAFSPGGDRLAAVDSKVVRIWTADGREEQVLGPAVGASRIAWHPGGRRLVTGNSWKATATIWSLDGGTQVPALRHGNAHVQAVAWSNDGRVASACSDGRVYIWSQEGAMQSSFKVDDEPAFNLGWNPQSTRLVVGSHSGARLWQPDGTLVKALFWKVKPWCCGAAFSPDGKWIATVPNLRIWNLAGEQIVNIHADKEWWGEQAICWSGDSTRLATVGTEGVGRIWKVDGSVGGPQFEEVGGSILWNPTRPQIATTRGIVLTTWDADTGEPQWTSLSVAGRSFRVTPSGEPLGEFDAKTAEGELVYQVKDESGRLQLLKPSQFNARIKAVHASSGQ